MVQVLDPFEQKPSRSSQLIPATFRPAPLQSCWQKTLRLLPSYFSHPYSATVPENLAYAESGVGKLGGVGGGE